MLKKTQESDFNNLLKYKKKLKTFNKIENRLQQKIDLLPASKERTKIEKELKLHKATFKKIEDNLVYFESKMIDLERGLYKGIAIDVRDKSYTRFPLYLKWANIKNHLGYTGTTRVGKTKNMIVDAQQLTKKGYDVIIVDPKGGEGQEILTETIQMSMDSKRTNDFKYLSPAFPKESELVNLLYGLEDEEIANMITTFAKSVGGDDGFFISVVYENTLAVVKTLTYIEAATDPSGEHTKELEKQELEKYILLKNYKDIKIKLSKDRWNNVSEPNQLHLSSKEEVEGLEFVLKAPVMNLYQNRSMVTLKTLSKYTTYKSIQNLKTTVETLIAMPSIEEVGHERYTELLLMKEEAISILEKVLSADEINFSKISKTHSVLLSQLVYGDIGKVFSGIGINPIANRLLSKEQGLICVMQPFPMKYKTIANMSVMAMLKMLESMLGLVGTSGRGLARPLVIMIDEAGSVVYKGIEDLFNKAAGLGATLIVYTQSPEDYSLALDDTNSNVIMDNVNTPITMRMNHLSSCQRAAEALGSVRKHQSMYMATDGGGGRFSIGNEDEPVAIAEDISSLPIAMGYMRHDEKTYLVDFPYVKGLESYPIRMPELSSEIKRRSIAQYEADLLIQHKSTSLEINRLNKLKLEEVS